MSLEFVHKFQLKIHDLLNTNDFIKNQVDKIYFSAVQDGKCPFILINISKIKDISRFSHPIYEVEFEISAFIKDKKNNFLINLAQNITKILDVQNCSFDEYLVAGMKSGEITFTKAQDLVLNKITINYKALLKKEGNI